MKKKLLAMMLTICMVIGMMPISAMADEIVMPPIGDRFIEINNETESIATILDEKVLEDELVNVTIKRDYMITLEDMEAIYQAKRIEIVIQEGTFSIANNAVETFNGMIRKFSFTIIARGKLMMEGKELFGSENAGVFVKSGAITIDEWDSNNNFDRTWGIHTPANIVVQEGGHRAALYRVPLGSIVSMRSSFSEANELVLTIKNDFTITNEEFFDKSGYFPLDANVNVEDNGILRVLNTNKFKGDYELPVSLINRQLDHSDEELPDKELQKCITVNGSGKVIFKNPITEKQKEALFVSEMKT
ncbi:MAG: hypothetical protein Q4D77_08145 [Peptostreptococcaceae bacterium]|nr:hypothetical protein [Peptostreptococcaceae bacterium]